MEEIARQLDEIMSGNPEWTFSEAMAELVKKGALDYAVLEDQYIHAALHSRYTQSKSRANTGRLNLDI